MGKQRDAQSPFRAVSLRPFFPDDGERLCLLANNRNVSKWLHDIFPYPYRIADAQHWIAQANRESRRCNFAIEVDGELAGGIGVRPLADVHSGTGELGYWLGEPYWGQGIASQAVALLCRHAFDELVLIRLQALVFSGNTASQRVLEKNGFRREGVLRRHVRKNGVITDAVLFARLRCEEGW
ncbi:MAG: GNAT family N-acetyltransferase [Planctomycetes bacterium]|nr:GNAT family N-acetyltransferase [Planctomycetota bacterium]